MPWQQKKKNFFFFENLNFVTKMCFTDKKSDVIVILSKIEISPADRLKFLFILIS